MKVIAIKEGFIGGVRRRVGDVFDIPDEQLEHEPVTGMPIPPRWCHRADDTAGAAKRIAEHKSRPARAVKAATGRD